MDFRTDYRPVCEDTKPCFARVNDRCEILTKTYLPNACPFRKTYQNDEQERKAKRKEQALDDLIRTNRRL